MTMQEPENRQAQALRGTSVDTPARSKFRPATPHSSELDAFICSGDVRRFAAALGDYYELSGEVCRGDQRGRTIGFPTANLVPPPGRALPAFGVYAALVDIDADRRFGAAVNVGVRPTVGSAGRPLIEAHILDFDEDIYGSPIAVRFVDRIRTEIRFDGIEELANQLRLDVELVRESLTRPISR